MRNYSDRTPEYRSWEAMRQRCLNPSNKKYPNYGGRGITICSRWDSFPVFLSDMGLKPSRQHTLDRIDNNLGYDPENCQWADYEQQGHNKRSTILNTEAAKVIRHFKAKGWGYGRLLSKLYGVTEATISGVYYRKSWR